MTSAAAALHLLLLAGAAAASWSSIESNDSEFHLLILGGGGATRTSCSGTTSSAPALHLLLLAGDTAASLGRGLSSSTSGILGSLSTLLLRLRGSRGGDLRPRSTNVSTGIVLTSAALPCGSTSQVRNWRSGRRFR